jgi:kynurenine formamidase
MRVIDISAPMRCGEEIACDVPAELPAYCGYACEEYRFSFRSHLGCYFETSAHLFCGGTMTSDVPVARLLLPAMVARLNAGRGGAIESDEIACALREPVRAGDALLVDTSGRDDRFFSRACAAWMVAQRVALLGATLERYDTGFGNPTGVFVEWFGAEIPIIAGLRDLDRVRAERVFLVVMPMPIEHVCTVPCRAVVLEGEAGEIAWLAEHLGSRWPGEDSSGATRIPSSFGRMGKERQR